MYLGSNSSLLDVFLNRTCKVLLLSIYYIFLAFESTNIWIFSTRIKPRKRNTCSHTRKIE